MSDLVKVSRPDRPEVTGRLVSRYRRRSKGQRARVLLPSGAVISVDPDHIEHIEETP